jgi:hypothetical protein
VRLQHLDNILAIPASGKMALRATASVLIFSLVFISASADEWGDWQDGRATY